MMWLAVIRKTFQARHPGERRDPAPCSQRVVESPLAALWNEGNKKGAERLVQGDLAIGG